MTGVGRRRPIQRDCPGLARSKVGPLAKHEERLTRTQWEFTLAPDSRESHQTSAMGIEMKLLLCSVPLALAASIALAAPPVENVSAKRHPNIAAAQRLSEQAFQRISAAQQANEFDMDGHAAKAKDLLDQVNRELKAAAESANRHK